ncbi:MAG TPA: peptidoglycan-binding domain-containing protein [Streptosporangiaceae bacterium]|jgi:peptidoglycan hydrolase-like protein with peptidoglycan-binding domain|nr:peptidoglycan-binding domain-containing protein [Streptosporangiaceae bacterium]
MSTQFDTQHTHPDDTHAYGQPAAGRHAPRQGGNGPSGYRILIIVIGTVIAAALIVLAAVGLTHTTSSSTPAPAASTSNPAQPTSPGQSVNPAQPTTPAVTPSASVKKLQQELGQLNYYEGPVDGLMGPQTIAAIKDLQRQAGLPQTGTMNAATQKALDNYLAHGNNQMGGNS